MFSPDGHHIAFTSGPYAQRISLLLIKEQAPQLLYEDIGNKSHLAFLPDGHDLVFMNMTGKHADIQVLNIDTRECRLIVRMF